MVNTELIQAIAHDLESHAHSIRVKKLIFYICKRVWENNLEALESYPLNHLIQELTQLYPNLTELENHLNRVAYSLSKPAEYSLIANLILQKIKKLYSKVQLESSLGTQQQLPQIVANLAQDINSIRIKKILVYICRNTWENNSDRLNQYNLKDLVEEVLEIAPNLESLHLVVNSIVKTLNRQAEYALVANTIITQLNKLYSKQLNSTQLLASSDSTQVLTQAEATNLLIEPEQSKLSSSVSPNNYSRIASLLESQPEQVRIKKLIFCTCRNYWENDPIKLDEVPLEVLTSELHAIAPAITNLKLLLANTVNTLNRKAEYSLVADTIVGTFEVLYTKSSNLSPVIQPFEHQSPVNSTPSIPHDVLPQPGSEATIEVEIENTCDPFELRLEIMKYTNPLRAKILLFSVLKHKFSFTTADWSALKSCGFDDLLQQLLEQCDSLSTLESRLEIIASCLEDSFEYNQAAGAIIQGVKPFCARIKPRQISVSITPVASSIYLGDPASEQTRIKLSAEETLLTSGYTNAETDDEHTCQFFPAANISRSVVERSPNELEKTCELPNNSYEC